MRTAGRSWRPAAARSESRRARRERCWSCHRRGCQWAHRDAAQSPPARLFAVARKQRARRVARGLEVTGCGVQLGDAGEYFDEERLELLGVPVEARFGRLGG